jgi:hypothetical protein
MSPSGGAPAGAADGGAGQGSNATDGGVGESATAEPNQGAGAEPVAQTAQGSTASSGSDDDDSFPVLPILIGILVLAALSVGAVLMRGRRQAADAA